jgi:hypothetical protein
MLTPSNFDVPVTYTWSVSGSSNVSITPNGSTCVVSSNSVETEENFTLSCVVKTGDKTLFQSSRDVVLSERPNFITAVFTASGHTRILSEYANIAWITYMEVDGVQITPTETYEFATLGQHTVRYTTKQTYRMFEALPYVESIDLSECDGRKYTSLDSFAMNCLNLKSINFNGFDGINITDMGYVFYSCTSLSSIQWGGCTFPNVTDLSKAFRGCSNLTEIDLTPFVGAPIANVEQLFYNCANLEQIDFTPLLSATLTKMDKFLYGCSSMKTIIAPWMVAPANGAYLFGQGDSSYTGRNTYNTGENMLYVPKDATDYGSTDWDSPLCNPNCCGFTISYTL